MHASINSYFICTVVDLSTTALYCGCVVFIVGYCSWDQRAWYSSLHNKPERPKRQQQCSRVAESLQKVWPAEVFDLDKKATYQLHTFSSQNPHSFTHICFLPWHPMIIFWNTRVRKGSSRLPLVHAFEYFMAHRIQRSLPHLADYHWILSTNRRYRPLSETEKTQQRNVYFTCARIRTRYFPSTINT